MPVIRRRNIPRFAELWLDLFPTDVCERIALHVSNSRPTTDALHLAETTPMQRSAVLSSLDHTLRINRAIGIDHSARWAALFARDSPRTLVCEPLVPTDFQDLLAFPQLRAVSIPFDQACLRTIAAASSIRELHLTVRGSFSQELFDTIRKSKLDKLTISSEEVGNVCPLGILKVMDGGTAPLRIACEHIRFVDIECCCLQRTSHAPWAFLKLPLPQGTREMILRESVPDTEMSYLRRQLESVRIRRYPKIGARSFNALATALYFGGSVKEFTHFLPLGRSEILTLANTCSNIETLEIMLKPGTERWLPNAIKRLRSLRVMRLSWMRGRWLDDDDVDRGPCFVKPETLVATIRNAQKLTELQLRGVRTSVREVGKILSMLPELRVLWLKFGCQDEHTFSRLEAILHLVIRHNTELREIRSREWGCDFTGFVGVEEIEEQGRRLHAALDRLEMSAPNVDSSFLRKFVTRAVKLYKSNLGVR